MGTVTLLIVGGWTRPQLLMRLLAVIDAPWQPGRQGLHERGSSAVCVVQMGPTDPSVAARIRAGEDPRAPSILETDWPDIDEHHAVLRVRSKSTDPRTAASDVLRCGAALVNAGGVAVVCEESGVAHAGTHWLGLADSLARLDPLPVLVQAFARYPVREGAGFRTRGLAELGLRDLVTDISEETVAHALCEDVVTRQVGGANAAGSTRVMGRTFQVALEGSVLRASSA